MFVDYKRKEAEEFFNFSPAFWSILVGATERLPLVQNNKVRMNEWQWDDMVKVLVHEVERCPQAEQAMVKGAIKAVDALITTRYNPQGRPFGWETLSEVCISIEEVLKVYSDNAGRVFHSYRELLNLTEDILTSRYKPVS